MIHDVEQIEAKMLLKNKCERIKEEIKMIARNESMIAEQKANLAIMYNKLLKQIEEYEKKYSKFDMWEIITRDDVNDL